MEKKCCEDAENLAFVKAVSEDLWGNRKDGMRCKTCMFHVLKETKHYVSSSQADLVPILRPMKQTDPERGRPGRCRRRAPTIDGWPVTFEMDWCGDHKLDENKI